MKMLPIGIEFFKDIRDKDYYYVDKTKFIEELLAGGNKVSLFTRPRRFGKTLNMSMLRSFFEVGADCGIFDGLYISSRKDLCEKYMGKYPVIFITLKGVEDLSFDDASLRLSYLIGNEANRFSFLENSERLNEREKAGYASLVNMERGVYSLERSVLISSLKILSELLYKHYGRKVVILIDEYDVPLDKAFQNGYYNEMVSLIRGLFGEALKTNEYLEFAVLTGCLRVSKESIFTGINNFKVLSITDVRFDEEFGFTESEVKTLLSSFGLEDHMKEMKAWYDGYRFGSVDVYCPWDVLSHVQRLLSNPDALPQSYWINSSGNGLVRRFIDKADQSTRDEIEALLSGETIEKEIHLELTYGEIDNTIDNLWSVLFTTGYLTLVGKPENGIYKLRIPNEEVKEVYKSQIREWFKVTVKKEKKTLDPLWNALGSGDEKKIEEIINGFLSRTISIFDIRGPKKEKEKFYTAFLTGILLGNPDWGVRAQRESGDGLPDIEIRPENPDAGIIIENKSVDKFTELEDGCLKAIEQVYEKRYCDALLDDGRCDIWIYGIAFYKKRCRVRGEKFEVEKSTTHGTSPGL